MAKIQTVLVVDDAPENIDVIKGVLKDYKVKAALNGEKALKILAKGSIDFVFLDIKMPGMGGLEVLEKMKADDKLAKIPAAMLSGSEDENEKSRARELGALEFLEKPVDSQKVLDVLNG